MSSGGGDAVPASAFLRLTTGRVLTVVSAFGASGAAAGFSDATGFSSGAAGATDAAGASEGTAEAEGVAGATAAS